MQNDSDNDDGSDNDQGSNAGSGGGGGGSQADSTGEGAGDEDDILDGRQDENPIEFVDDSCERNQNAWLRFPPEFINPAKMCSVNKFVQCVDESFLHYNLHHVPYGPEYVLVGHDSPSLPTHFLKWIWAMSQINCMQHYPNCVVPVVALTEVRQQNQINIHTISDTIHHHRFPTPKKARTSWPPTSSDAL